MIERWRKAGLTAPLLATLIVAAMLAGLGTWQMNRKAWKEGLLAEIAKRMAEAPIDATQRLWVAGAPLPQFTRVTLTGRFLHDRERYWFADGRLGSGFHVFTPLQVDPSRIVWVNRGYVPKNLRDPKSRPAGQIEGATIVTGVVREPGERNSFTPPNDVAHNVWFWRDLPALTASAGLAIDTLVAPIMVDAEPSPANPGGWPEGQNGQISLPNRHLEYALTWYGLATAVIGVFLAFSRGRMARNRE